MWYGSYVVRNSNADVFSLQHAACWSYRPILRQDLLSSPLNTKYLGRRDQRGVSLRLPIEEVVARILAREQFILCDNSSCYFAIQLHRPHWYRWANIQVRVVAPDHVLEVCGLPGWHERCRPDPCLCTDATRLGGVVAARMCSVALLNAVL